MYTFYMYNIILYYSMYDVAETTRIFHAPDYRLFIIKLHSEKT